MSFIAANVGLAPLASSKVAPLTNKRTISALLLAPLALLAIYAGSPWFDLFIAVAGLAMAWEWFQMMETGRLGGTTWLRAAWNLLGLPVVVVPCLSLIWLRTLPETGLEAILWLFGAVWTTDVAAYFIGRRFGRTKLAPRVSPGKTWAGLIGAIIFAAIWSGAWDYWIAGTGLVIMLSLGAITAVIAQTGDLSISWIKRRCGVKDASNLIPGHGGMLDRMDGFLVTAPLLAFLVKATGKGSVVPW